MEVLYVVSLKGCKVTEVVYVIVLQGWLQNDVENASGTFTLRNSQRSAEHAMFFSEPLMNHGQNSLCEASIQHITPI